MWHAHARTGTSSGIFETDTTFIDTGAWLTHFVPFKGIILGIRISEPWKRVSFIMSLHCSNIPQPYGALTF